MRIKGTILARAIQGVRLSPGQYIPDAVRSVGERYGFVDAPSAPEDLLGEEKPLVFRHGKLVSADRSHVVHELAIYSGAFVVDFSTSTDEAELFLDDIVRWGIDQGLLASSEGVPRRFVSQLEVSIAVDLDDVVPALSELRRSLARTLGKYEPDLAAARTPVGVYSFAVSVDPLSFATSCDFRVERRHGQPFASNVYFTQAPLRTADHVALLEELERSFARTGPAKR